MEKRRMIANHDDETKRLLKLYIRQCRKDDIEPIPMAYFIREGFKYMVKSQLRIEGICSQTIGKEK